MNLFFSDDIRDQRIFLSEEESNHCIRVLRMKAGDRLQVTSGKGVMYDCAVAVDNPHACVLEIMETKIIDEDQGFRVHIAIAPTKNSDRFEWFLEKATEIGIDEITPVFCDHSERRRLNMDRSYKVLISAMKQSLKFTLPVLNDPGTLKSFLEKPVPGQKFIAWCETGKEESLASLYHKGSDVTILIGPEGDFSPKEILAALAAGWIPISLGKSRLRTETAGIVAVHTINLVNGC